jgi:hypothetical protein
MLRAAIAVLLYVASTAQAMTFTAQPPILYLGGSVVAEDWKLWQEAMTRYDGKIDTVVMHDSGGGDAGAGRRIGQDIRKRGFTTIVSGRCSSACANMFLAGTTRQFSAANEKRENVLGYHGSYNKVTKALNTKRTPDYFVQMTGGKMSEEFVERFIKLENNKGLMRFFHRDQRASASAPLAQLCNGLENRNKRDEECERLADVDALGKGVVTTWDVRDIGMPPTPSREKVAMASWRSEVVENIPPRSPLASPHDP